MIKLYNFVFSWFLSNNGCPIDLESESSEKTFPQRICSAFPIHLQLGSWSRQFRF